MGETKREWLSEKIEERVGAETRRSSVREGRRVSGIVADCVYVCVYSLSHVL